MNKFSLEFESTEEETTKLLDDFLKLSAYKASTMLKDLGVYEILNRPRSPEEIFHMLNFSSLDVEFFKIFELLADQELLTKQGEFYGDSPRREYLEITYQEDFKSLNNRFLAPLHSFIDKSVRKYKSILKGEQGKLSEAEYVHAIDSISGTEMMYIIRDLFFKSLKLRLPAFDTKEKLNVLNWGVGSGYDALHFAEFFGDKVSVISSEPTNSLYRCQVLQDIYEIYNVEFVQRDEMQLDVLKDSIDLYLGSKYMFKTEEKHYINTIQSVLNAEGYLAFSMIPQLDLSLGWLLSIYEPFFLELEKESHMAKLKHYGISREKYIGLANGFILMQKI